jgi:hypothetical protein
MDAGIHSWSGAARSHPTDTSTGARCADDRDRAREEAPGIADRRTRGELLRSRPRCFWLHRYLVAQGITNYVVDSSSIEVNRRARRAKTDRLDVTGLLSLLARYAQGDQRAWRVVRIPTVVEEDARHLPRTLEALTQDRTRSMSRLKSLDVVRSATDGPTNPNACVRRRSASVQLSGVPVACSPPCRRVRRGRATYFTFFRVTRLACNGLSVEGRKKMSSPPASYRRTNAACRRGITPRPSSDALPRRRRSAAASPGTRR